MPHYLSMKSPVGLLTLVEEDKALTAIHFGNPIEKKQVVTPLLRETEQQLGSYFSGKLKAFDLPLAPKGSLFRQKVWNALSEIPYGSTTTYLKLARELGDENAIRAVGTANGANPLPIVIPCHRVIGSNGELTGYAGGLPIKKKLLELEQNVQQIQLF